MSFHILVNFISQKMIDVRTTTSTWNITIFLHVYINVDFFLHSIKFWSLEVFYKNSVSSNIFFCHSPYSCKKVFLLRPFFATLEKCARFSRAHNFARTARQKFVKKFEFIKRLNICKIRMVGKTLDRPENERFQRISRNLRDMTRKNQMYIWRSVNSLFFQKLFFDPILKNEKAKLRFWQ